MLCTEPRTAPAQLLKLHLRTADLRIENEEVVDMDISFKNSVGARPVIGVVPANFPMTCGIHVE